MPKLIAAKLTDGSELSSRAKQFEQVFPNCSKLMKTRDINRESNANFDRYISEICSLEGPATCANGKKTDRGYSIDCLKML